ncbi:hypothetical protein I4U23_022498 [Adineta vaga]|nr:hypothetical protein I4U23_022498 [Adineta vaga]
MSTRLPQMTFDDEFISPATLTTTTTAPYCATTCSGSFNSSIVTTTCSLYCDDGGAYYCRPASTYCSGQYYSPSGFGFCDPASIGLLLSLLLPTIIIGILSLVFLVYPLIKQILRYYNYLPIPYAKDIIRTTYSARCEGDFVVFLIGIRPNGANPFTKSFGDIGKAFQSMIAELESDSTLGYMGGDVYVGANERKSTLMYVQYWRSYEALQQWTHTKMGIHVKIVMEYMKSDRVEGVNGIWHETYKVRDGEYEAIYGNMPPIGLGLATQIVLETKTNNGAGRMKRRENEKQAVEEIGNVCKND